MSDLDMLEQWTSQVEALSLVVSSPMDEARGNTLWFSVDEAMEVGLERDDLYLFIMASCERVLQKARSLGVGGVFYCWLDEQSSTVRCSFSSRVDPAAFTFSCELDVSSDFHALADLVFEVVKGVGVPWSDLDVCSEGGAGEVLSSCNDFVLKVFVREVVLP